MARFPLTVFLSAFLLFQVQPIIARFILPWFGGSPAVWTVCLLFFQLLLLAGYAYAHWISGRLSGRSQTAVHVGLLATSLLFLPIAPAKPADSDHPTRQILLLLAASVGLPYLLLSSTGPLVQRWFQAAHSDRSPYRLYALSNAAALVALLSYPFAVEPALTLGRQVQLWSWTYVAFVVVSAWSGTGILACPSKTSPVPKVPFTTILYWLLLSACGSTLLLATTNQLCREVAVVPFLWILPLAVYLVTFMISFHSDRWYDRRWFGLLAALSVPAACGVVAAGLTAPLWAHIASYSAALFACAMICHGELALARPDPKHLTVYYLVIAAGGALGGMFVGLVAPKLFIDYSEFHISLAAACLLGLGAWHRSGAWKAYRERPHSTIGPITGVATAAVVAMVALAYTKGPKALAAERNFYGILRVTEENDPDGLKRVLTHGRVTHGFQYTEALKRSWPTTYYGEETGVGLAIRHHPRRAVESLRIGVVGLGAGTIAAYGRPGDLVRFYEIDPDVARIAGSFFTYVDDSASKVEVILGDARKQMEQEAARGQNQDFDVLAIDAFSSDAIPIHLLTAECAELYRKHLKADGLLALHISNRSVDLAPVARGLAERFRWRAVRIASAANPAKGASRATWVILTNNESFLQTPEVARAAAPDASRPPLVWTDDFASLWPVLRWGR